MQDARLDPGCFRFYEAAQKVLAEHGVGNAVYYPTPIHRLRPFLESDGKPGREDLPETDRAAA